MRANNISRGRPIFDLAKFFIWDLVHYPDQKDTFLKAYGQYIELSQNFKEIMKFYLLLECFGMIAYFDKIGAMNDRDGSLTVLNSIIEGVGVQSADKSLAEFAPLRLPKTPNIPRF